jgi:hypothetical protein
MEENNVNRVWGASYDRGVRLSKAGCSLPYLNALPGRGSFHQRSLYLCQLDGYFDSYAIDFGMNTAYVIALRVGTGRTRGAIILSYELVLPWPDHEIEWGYDPREWLSKSKIDIYGKLSESRLPAVLDERRLLSRGRPVEGLLCGYACTPIPASRRRDGFAVAEMVLVEDSGTCARSPVQLTIYNRAPARAEQPATIRRPIFDDDDDSAYNEVAERDFVLQNA